MEIATLKKIDINAEMQQAYLDYAMSVIVSRALPDARDGLKPVHRRILYAMHDMNLNPASPHKKSARIVGEVLGKYHPHSDQAVYDAMARMAQEFSTRYPLVDGQGNFGSIDGDPPAAMRYTEARLTAAAVEILADIDKDTVEFGSNFDDTLVEPAVLPSAIPNLIVNGATGIAVGMSTNVPPHNLSEVIEALKFMLGKWTKLDDVTVEDLMEFVQGPDFPTGGVILQEEEESSSLKHAYGTGRGRVTVQARVHLEEASRGRTRLIVTELPYMTNKTSLIERIASLARDGVIEGIADLRDESARDEMRIVVELSKGIEPDAVLGDLYKKTPMQSTFSIIILALVDGEPRLLGLKQALRVFLEHRLEVVRRRSEYELQKARHQAHILEGLRIAIANLEKVIALIRKSQTVQTAKDNLRKTFKLSEDQALAILNMPLRRLASLERQKIETEYKELTALIKKLQELLKSPVKMRTAVTEELDRVKTAFGDRRRTQIVSLDGKNAKTAVLTARDLAPDQQVWISVMEDGRISRTADEKSPRLSGSAAASWLIEANTRDTLYLVNEQGEAAAIGVHALPVNDSPPDGTPYAQITPLRGAAGLAAVFNLPAREDRAEGWFALGVTTGGMVKKTEVRELPGPSGQSTFTLVKVNDGDRLGWVHISNGENEILMATASGMAIRFTEEEVRPMGLVAAGVSGIKLKVGDAVIGSILLPAKHEALLIRGDGIAKRVKIGQFPQQGRYGQGVIAWPLEKGERLVGLVTGKGTQKVTLHLAKLAPKQIRLDEAPVRGRPSNGSRVLELKSGDRIVRVTNPETYPRPVKDE